MSNATQAFVGGGRRRLNALQELSSSLMSGEKSIRVPAAEASKPIVRTTTVIDRILAA